MTVVQPGDTLIIGLEPGDSEEQLSNLRKAIGAQVPGVNVLVVAGATSMASYRPGELGAMETKSAANG